MDRSHFIPINKAAAIAVSKGFEYVPNKKPNALESKNPLPTRELNKGEINQKCFADLTGFEFARFTVIGKYTVNACWVVRCSCGVYSVRRSKSILNPKNTQDRCEECRHLAFLKRDEVRRRTGKDVDINNF